MCLAKGSNPGTVWLLCFCFKDRGAGYALPLLISHTDMYDKLMFQAKSACEKSLVPFNPATPTHKVQSLLSWDPALHMAHFPFYQKEEEREKKGKKRKKEKKVKGLKPNLSIGHSLPSFLKKTKMIVIPKLFTYFWYDLAGSFLNYELIPETRW